MVSCVTYLGEASFAHISFEAQQNDNIQSFELWFDLLESNVNDVSRKWKGKCVDENPH